MGKVKEAFVPWKTRKGCNFIFAFVRFVKEEDAIKTIRYEDGKRMGSKRIKVH